VETQVIAHEGVIPAAPLQGDALVERGTKTNGEMDAGGERTGEDRRTKEPLIVSGEAEIELVDLVAGLHEGSGDMIHDN
jgi:hypothetical protein